MNVSLAPIILAVRALEVLLAVSILISGCSGLILRDTDSAKDTTGKVAARVVLAPMTIGLSELRIYETRQEELCDQRGRWYFMGACRDVRACDS